MAAELDLRLPAGEKLGVAVSGGPDSLALLVLAASARPGNIEAATVDHSLRPESAGEAGSVAEICRSMGVPHETLTVDWLQKPQSALQEQARLERYRLLAAWAKSRGLPAVATAHHLDDQAETLLMRLVRGAGVQGLAGMRPIAPIPVHGSTVRLIRPLLGWRRSELARVCEDAGLKPADDPSNADEQYERVRVRTAMAKADWLDPAGLARSASNLATADAALRWAADREWESQVSAGDSGLVYRPRAPLDIRRRVVARAIVALSSEGEGSLLRGREIDQALATLAQGGKATLRGVLYEGGEDWRFAVAPTRRLSS